MNEEELDRRLALLGDDKLRSIVLWKIQGVKSDEIAARFGYAVITVERKWALIRRKWGDDEQTGGPCHANPDGPLGGCGSGPAFSRARLEDRLP